MEANSLMSKIKKWYKAHVFIVMITLIATQVIVFYIFYYMPAFENHVVFPLAHVYGQLSSKILNVFAYQTTSIGDTISSSQFSVSIRKGCDALEPMALITAGIIAFPSTLKEKFFGLSIGLSFLFILNLVRIVALFLTGIYFPNYFEAMHMQVWQIVFIIAGIGYWFFWVKRAVKKAKPA